jgi:hypothetical protein
MAKEKQEKSEFSKRYDYTRVNLLLRSIRHLKSETSSEIH